jgi:hypothetical protein
MLKMYDASQLVSSQARCEETSATSARRDERGFLKGAAYGTAATCGAACASRLSATARRCRSVEPAIAGLET